MKRIQWLVVSFALFNAACNNDSNTTESKTDNKEAAITDM